MYKKENEYLKQENKRLLDIIAIKEQRDLAKDVNTLNSGESTSFFSKILKKFNKSNSWLSCFYISFVIWFIYPIEIISNIINTIWIIIIFVSTFNDLKYIIKSKYIIFFTSFI